MLSKFFEFITSAFCGLIIKAINQLPDIDFTIPENVFDGLKYIFDGIAYFIPIKALLPILFIDISISVFQIVWALILRIKSFIPTMGA
jgi:hypothetical protein